MSDDGTGSAPSKGLEWATVMLILQVFELLVLLEIVFADRSALSTEPAAVSPVLSAYLWAVALTIVVQLTGMALVLAGRYRLGGILQVAASAPHVIKIEGLIGVVGGLRAYRYPAREVAVT